MPVKSSDRQSTPLRVFISYAHEDDAHKIALEKSLRLLKREGAVETWSDRKLLGGDEWRNEIDRRLEAADLILLLVSPDFVDSDYCWDIEMTRALARHDGGEARVVPIVVRPCEWEMAPFGKLQMLPADAKPVTTWADADTAWLDVTRELRRIVSEQQPVAAGVRMQARGGVDPTGYLARIREENSYVELRGMGAQVAEQLPLDAVYTRLRVLRRGDQIDEPPGTRFKPGRGKKSAAMRALGALGDLAEPRDLDLKDVLEGHAHLALIGDPGSGKTTFLRFVAQTLARATLEGNGALCQERLGLSGPPPFPVWARLTEFAKFLQKPCNVAYPDDAPDHLLRFLDFTQGGDPCGLGDGELSRRVREGGCFLLLDGLDEVPAGQAGGDDQRARVARIVQRIVVLGKQVGNRHLLACRTRAYERQSELAAHVASCELAPFTDDQVREFVTSWAWALRHVERGDAKSEAARLAAAYAAELQAAIESHPSVGPLTSNPLMLTVLAVVHWNRRRLPQERIKLYEAAADYLLESRHELSVFQKSLRGEAMQALALRMFEDSEGVQRSLGRKEAAAAVAPVLGIAAEDARGFLDDESLYSGLLVMRTEGEFEFWHLTFQEYLAARELAADPDPVARLLDKLDDDRWREVILLLGGCLRDNGIRPAREYIRQILATSTDRVTEARAVAVVGQVLHDIEIFGGQPAASTSYDAALKHTLAIFKPGGALVEESVRVAVGEALGHVGDPRLVDAAALRVDVPGGSFLMGAQRKDRKAPGFDPEASGWDALPRQVNVPGFRMGRFPVTVQEYRRFVDAKVGGHSDPHNWDPQGWAWREQEKIATPDEWLDQLQHPNRPVVGVSWYEADAFAKWMGGRLPTDEEWEWAARGAGVRRYPWGGDDPTEAHAAFGGRRQAPSPVGIYPLGATPEGICDLAGNVWEWCASLADESLQARIASPNEKFKEWVSSARVLRGGSFYGPPSHPRGASRYATHPDNRYDYFGFRVVWSASGGNP